MEAPLVVLDVQMAVSELQDRYVDFLSESRIAECAHSWRCAHGNSYAWRFDVVDFLLNTFMKRFKGGLELKLFKRNSPKDVLAYATFKPNILHVDENIWALAKAGSAYAQYIIAHEIGHFVLHSNLPKGFSSDPGHQITYAENGHSAEWQANTFAGYLQLPTAVVEQFDHSDEIIEMCEVWDVIAESRFSAVHAKRIHLLAQPTAGEACANCGNFSLIRRGTEVTCKFCKSSYGS